MLKWIGVMMSSKKTCIYCGSQETIFAHAHALPRSLGNFKNHPTLLDRVCSACDTEIGKCEEQLVKCTSIAILRLALEITGRSRDLSTSSFRRKYTGHGPLRFIAQYPGTNYEILTEPIPRTKNWQPIPQIVIVAPNEDNKQILINENVTFDEFEKQIRQCISTFNQKGCFKIWAIAATVEEQDHIIEILRKTKIYNGEDIDDKIKPCFESTEIIGTIEVDTRYFRAIAKIAFHYFLIHNNDFSGYESCFEPIRRFIRYGEGENDFVVQKKGNLVADINQGYRPKYYGHFLISSVNNSNLVTDVQLFIGHDLDPPYYTVLLGKNPRTIILPTQQTGHFYSYFEPENRKEYTGEMQELHYFRYIKPIYGLQLP